MTRNDERFHYSPLNTEHVCTHTLGEGAYSQKHACMNSYGDSKRMKEEGAISLLDNAQIASKSLKSRLRTTS